MFSLFSIILARYYVCDVFTDGLVKASLARVERSTLRGVVNAPQLTQPCFLRLEGLCVVRGTKAKAGCLGRGNENVSIL